MTTVKLTPWQRVYQKFNVSGAELARLLNRHRSKLSRELADPDGLISKGDQKLLVAAAEQRGITLTPSDMTGL